MNRVIAHFVNKQTALIYKGFLGKLVYVHSCRMSVGYTWVQDKYSQMGIDDIADANGWLIDHTLVNKSVWVIYKHAV